MRLIKIKEVVLTDLVKRLKEGQVLALPTETVYGLVADATNKKAVKKIYQIKGRNFNKPLPVICSSLDMAKNFFYLPKVLEILAKKYWPGPLAIRFKVKNKKIKVSQDNTVVARVSSYDLLTKLAKKLGKPITATSANLAGQNECHNAGQVINQFKNIKYQPDLIIDGGQLPPIKPSTIVALEKDQLVVLRQGEIKI